MQHESMGFIEEIEETFSDVYMWGEQVSLANQADPFAVHLLTIAIFFCRLESELSRLYMR